MNNHKDVVYSILFVKNLKKIPFTIQKLAQKKEALLTQDLHHPTLRTHKLSGKLQAYYSFSINHEYRILFRIHNNIIEFVNIGTHSIYK